MTMFKTTAAKTPIEYIALLPAEQAKEIKLLHSLIRKTTPELKPFIISGMIGYGKYQFKSRSGREGEWMVIGLAQQKNYISVYACVSDGTQYIPEKYKKDLPKASIGKSCIRFKKVSDISVPVLTKVLKEAARIAKKQHYRFEAPVA